MLCPYIYKCIRTIFLKEYIYHVEIYIYVSSYRNELIQTPNTTLHAVTASEHNKKMEIKHEDNYYVILIENLSNVMIE